MVAYTSFNQIPLFRYGFIMADYPWEFQNWSEKGDGRSPSQHYDVMSVRDLYEIPIGNFCAPNAIIWFWTTGPFVPDAIKILEYSGLRYVTMGYWGKVQKKDATKPKMGGGHVLRECGEPFIIAKVGKPAFTDKAIEGLILDPRRESGRKPERAYEFAERMAPKNSPRLDLFSRQERSGWDCFGNETDKFGAVA